MRWYSIKQDQSEFFPELDGCQLRACKFRAVGGHLSPIWNQSVYRGKPDTAKQKQVIEVERARESWERESQRERQRESRGTKP